MTSPPDSSPTTAASENWLHDRFDIVATQGAYLEHRSAGTPVFEKAYDDQFSVVLTRLLNALLIGQNVRRVIYQRAADEYLEGYTPPELKEKRKAELEAFEELWDVTSDDGSDNDDVDNCKDKGGSDIDAGVGAGKSMAAPDRSWRPQRPLQADRLQTLPPSAASPLATPQRGKRRRTAEEDEEEKQHLAEKHVSSVQEVSAFAGDAVPSVARQKDWKRRRTLDKGDEEGGDEEPPRKVRVTTTRPSSSWLQRLRLQRGRPAG